MNPFDKETQQGVITHMNSDHRASLAKYYLKRKNMEVNLIGHSPVRILLQLIMIE